MVELDGLSWARRDDLAEVASDGRVALLRLAQLDQPPVILEGSASVIWNLVDGAVTRDQLIAGVAAAFAAEPSEVGPAVGAFLDDLTSLGMLTRSTSCTMFVTALELPIRVDMTGSCGDLLAERLRAAWAQSVTSGRGIKPAATISLRLDDPDDLRATLEWGTQQVTSAAIKCRAGTHLMFHACAVADPVTGDSVLMVGPSGMGKTTIAADLGQTWAYVTDETAAVDADGTLLAYPKPLSVVDPDGLAKNQLAPESIGLIPAPASLRVRAVLLLDRRGRLGETSAEEPQHGLAVGVESTVQAVARLAEHTSYLNRLDRPLHRVAALLNATGGLRTVRYDGTGDLVPLISELIGNGVESEA